MTELFLQGLFDRAQEGLRDEISSDEYERRRWEFGFHLTDCQEDLKKLSELLEHPNQYDEEAARTLVMSALLHMTPHLKAATKLLWDEISDPFEQPAKSGQ